MPKNRQPRSTAAPKYIPLAEWDVQFCSKYVPLAERDVAASRYRRPKLQTVGYPYITRRPLTHPHVAGFVRIRPNGFEIRLPTEFSRIRPLVPLAAACGVFALLILGLTPDLYSQSPNSTFEAPDPQVVVTSDELQRLAAEAAASRNAPTPQPNNGLGKGLNFLKLLVQGGGLMIPIGLMSLLVVAVAFERWFNLRAGSVLPRKLRHGLEVIAEQRFSADPQEVYQLALRHPSVTSRVVENMLRKVGRPMPEMSAAVSEACQRETDRLYGNVRWLTLAVAVTPLIGLLGTVWGMILAFYNTTQLGPGQNKTEFLAEGIYIALVTTLGGLGVAIPAAMLAHYFEGRIGSQMARIEELVLRLLPRFERYEGRVRYDLETTGLVARNMYVDPALATHDQLPMHPLQPGGLASSPHIAQPPRAPASGIRPAIGKKI